MQDKKCNDIHKRDLQKMIWSLGGGWEFSSTFQGIRQSFVKNLKCELRWLDLYE